MCLYCSMRTARQLSCGSGDEQAAFVHHRLQRHDSWATSKSNPCDSRLCRVPTSCRCQLSFVCKLLQVSQLENVRFRSSRREEASGPKAALLVGPDVMLSSNVTPSIVALVQVGIPRTIVSDTQACWQHCSAAVVVVMQLISSVIS